jgi:dihydropteroate synthase
MGVLNVTPDSFSDGGLYHDSDCAIERAIQMVEEGADIIDIGGESTRPGATEISVDEEINRVIPVIEGVRKEIKIPISIDTQKSEVAEAAIQSGADIVNDISGFHRDKRILSTIKKYDIPVIIMHMRGSPKTMQQNTAYDNLMIEMTNYLEECIQMALEAGIQREKIIVDPGIGFGKKWEDNYSIIDQLKMLKSLQCPILIGVSRKSFIGHLLDVPESQRMIGTAAAVAASIINGVHIIRVHDVKEMVQVAKIIDRIKFGQ